MQEQVVRWKKHWEERGAEVIDYPYPIPAATFFDEYPDIYANFFKNIKKADILFVMNEDKNSIKGYIGAESFAEMCFAVAQNRINGGAVEIILLKMPEEKVQSYDEVTLWLKLGWVSLYTE